MIAHDSHIVWLVCLILNSANPVLRYQVIKYGKLVFEESEDVRVEFEVKVLREYMDMEYFRKVQMDMVREWAESIAVVGDDND